MLDLDGVIYIGANAVPGVPDVMARLRRSGMRIAFVTNNAARTPASVAEHLTSVGVQASASDVVTSAQAAARALEGLVPPSSRVLLVGGEGLREVLMDRGFVPVDSADDDPAAVVSGFDPLITWKQLAEGSYAARTGLPWVASNTDLTIPTARGIAPGNGTLVDAVAAAAGRRPTSVAGKPFTPLFDETVARVGSEHPIVVGDRLDTDISGAINAGADSLLVLTGVTDLDRLCHAVPEQRPCYVSRRLDGLLRSHAAPSEAAGGGTELAGWMVRVVGGTLTLDAKGDDPDDGVRAVVQAAWSHLDTASGAARFEGLAEVAAVLGVAGSAT